MNKNSLLIVAAAVLLVIGVGISVVFQHPPAQTPPQPAMPVVPTSPPVANPAAPVKTTVATFACDGGKSIKATFYPDNDTKVDLVLSDGRTMSLPHAISADGARYANADESIVFWNRGNTAFMTEAGVTTFANCATPAQPAAYNLDKTFTDAAAGITFKYPSTLGTIYIHTNQWPPTAKVSTEPFTCVAGGSSILQNGQTQKVTVGGNSYCLTTESEGAAGSTYTTYAYAFPSGNKVVTLTFILQFPQCLNYDDPQQTACTKESAAFDSDALMDAMAQSVVLK